MLYIAKFPKWKKIIEIKNEIAGVIGSEVYILKQLENSDGTKSRKAMLYIPNESVGIFESEKTNIIIKSDKGFKTHNVNQIFTNVQKFTFFPLHYPGQDSNKDFFIQYPSFGTLETEDCIIRLKEYFELFERNGLVKKNEYIINIYDGKLSKTIGFEIKFLEDVKIIKRVAMKLILNKSKWCTSYNKIHANNQDKDRNLSPLTRSKSCESGKTLFIDNSGVEFQIRKRSNSDPVEDINRYLRINCQWKFSQKIVSDSYKYQ